MKNCLVLSFITISLIKTVASDDCSEKCVKTDQCLAFGKLNPDQQQAWQTKYSCTSSAEDDNPKVFGFAPEAKGDFVCCSNAALQYSINSIQPGYSNNLGAQNNYAVPNTGYNYPNSQTPNNYNNYGNNNPNTNGWGSGSNENGYPNQGVQTGNGYQPVVNTPTPPSNYFNVNNNPYVTPNPYFPVPGSGNNGGVASQGQCPITSYPPKPETGCCGREASDTDRIIDRPKPPSYYDNGPETGNQPNSYENSAWPSWMPRQPAYNPHSRVARAVPISIGTRITGGKETSFKEFPWTVLLEITFDYGNKRQAFNCGGSLLSNKYVLTAGHCVYDKGGKVVDIEIYLAEYDKRTFPRDCKMTSHGKECIENVLMKAEDFILHPQYDDTLLNNDIALIRIKGNAPYTDYIRPICLPSIDVDSPQFSNLRLAVVGWGRNGRYRSNIKQSTIVNLVPQAKCKKYYPDLSNRQMCAAGYTGEDTCKGDSGGPLMTLYGGKYEVVGVVSGKRADSPCGTSVPSLYTSVYVYNGWIRANMKP